MRDANTAAESQYAAEQAQNARDYARSSMEERFEALTHDDIREIFGDFTAAQIAAFKEGLVCLDATELGEAMLRAYKDALGEL